VNSRVGERLAHLPEPYCAVLAEDLSVRFDRVINRADFVGKTDEEVNCGVF
jgi:hypothetical protein